PKVYEDLTLLGVSPITNAKPGTLTWSKNSHVDWESIKASVIICPPDSDPPEESNCFVIRVQNPRLAFTKVLHKFFPDSFYPRIEETAILSDTCQIGENVYIGHYVVIGENVKIGNGTIIHSHVKLYPNTIIKDNCIVHSGCTIGGDGFGYERNHEQIPIKIPHLGGVIIHENVE
ncbi:LpxD N-terminal domain-containing protein, partial [Enterococcus faecium]|uniref:LpxD N-terminal domain-containing protein n=1 Tax=Enterococcus faecium TaxID=1352 RepID=UPI0030C7EDBF